MILEVVTLVAAKRSGKGFHQEQSNGIHMRVAIEHMEQYLKKN